MTLEQRSDVGIVAETRVTLSERTSRVKHISQRSTEKWGAYEQFFWAMALFSFLPGGPVRVCFFV
jgi:hypothetical protein